MQLGRARMRPLPVAVWREPARARPDGPVAVIRALALAAPLLLAACSAGDTAAPTSATATTAVPASTTTATTTVVDARPFETQRFDIEVVDETRGVDADDDRGLAAQPVRRLPVLLLAPVGDGPFPVVVFAHGVTASGPAYEPLLQRVAAAGYVVAAPTFPLSSGPTGEIFDYVNQPGDVHAVLDDVVARGDDPADPLYGRVDGEHVALAGHSLGAMTTIGAALNSCCVDPEVDAAMALSGIEAPFPGGDYVDRPPVPLLVVHGEADQTIAITGSEDLYARATGPAAFLRFPAGGHVDILVAESGDLTVAAMVAWLDRWLLDDPTALAALPAQVDSSGIATFEQKP